MGEKKLTIRDVSRLAGVSKSTVSRYINGQADLLSDEAKRKVEEVIKEYNYVPSRLARSLATNSTKTIGVSIADITNPFSSVMINGIDDECKKRGYSLLFANSNNDGKEEVQIINHLVESQVDGLIINTTGHNDKFITNLENQNVVMIDRLLRDNHYMSVTSDNYNSTFEMISLLCNDYHYEEVYFVSQGMEKVSTRTIRYEAFQDALLRHLKIDPKSYQITIDDNNEDEFREQVLKASSTNKKVAFFTVNGVALQFLLQVLKDEGIKFPEDVGVCTYEYWDWTELINDGITSIAQDSYEMGRKSAELLINQIENVEECSSNKEEIYKIQNEILIRGSC